MLDYGIFAQNVFIAFLKIGKTENVPEFDF